MNRCIIYGLFILLVFVISCVTREVIVPESLELTPAHLGLLKKLKDTLPENGYFTGRIVLNLNGAEFDFVSYTAFDRDNFRALGMGEIGSRIFDFLFSDNKTDVLAYPKQIPIEVLKNGPVGDIKHILNTLSSQRQPHSCGVDCLIVKSNKDAVIYTFDAEGSIASSKEIINGTLVREVRYLNWKLFTGWKNKIPTSIDVANYDYNYSFSLNITDMKEGLKHDASIFRKTSDSGGLYR